MRDEKTIERIATAHPAVRNELYLIYDEIREALNGKAIFRVTRVWSSFAEQDVIYQQGRSKPGKIVTWAKAGFSYHNYALAVNFVLLVDRDNNGTFEEASWETNVDFDGDGQADWMEIVNIFTKYGWEWGGNWNKPKTDKPHMQKTFGYSVVQLKEKWDKKEFIPGTNYIQLG